MQRPVHILTNTLVGGGAEKQMLLCAEALAQSGRRVTLWVLTAPAEHPRYAPLLARCRTAGVRIEIIAGVVGRAVGLARLALVACRGGLLWTWGFRAELLRLLCPPLWIPRGVVSFRSASHDEMAKRAWLVRLTRPITAAYVANSVQGATLAQGYVSNIQSRCHILYNAVEQSLQNAPAALLRRPGGKLRVAMLGNLFLGIKGYDIALQTAAILKSRGHDFEIIIGGAPHDIAPFLELRKKLGLEDVVTFVGKVADPVAFLSSADAYLLLSRYEGTPNALLEAMALGLPCGATDVGDVAVFAAACPGLTLLPVGDAEAAARCVEHWLRDAASAAAAGADCRLYCQRQFSEAAMAEALKTIFAKLG